MTVTNYYDDDESGNTTTVTLAVLEGAVAVRGPRDGGGGGEDAVRLVSGEAMDVTGLHGVTTVSGTPSCYVYAATTESGGGGGCERDGGGGDDDNGPPLSAVGGGRGRRAGCSDACYAFAFDAVRAAFSAIF